MTDHENSEQTTGGLIGTLAGKTKEVAGSLVGDNDLAREGRLQQSQADADAEATRGRLGDCVERQDVRTRSGRLTDVRHC